MNNRSDLDHFYADNIGLIHTVARKGYGRFQAIGANIGYDDLVQELSVTFIKAYDGFDPTQGKFSTYFMFSAYAKINKMAKGFSMERCELGIRSFSELDETIGIENANIESVLPGDNLTPEQIVENRSGLEAIANTLSPLALLIAEWVLTPPDFVLYELEAHRAHVEYARGLGFERRNKATLSIGFVCDMIKRLKQVSGKQLREARIELQKAIKENL